MDTKTDREIIEAAIKRAKQNKKLYEETGSKTLGCIEIWEYGERFTCEKDLEMLDEIDELKKTIAKLAIFIDNYTGSCPVNLYNWKPPYDCAGVCGTKYNPADCWVEYLRQMDGEKGK